jgi:hypothetical protein
MSGLHPTVRVRTAHPTRASHPACAMWLAPPGRNGGETNLSPRRARRAQSRAWTGFVG